MCDSHSRLLKLAATLAAVLISPAAFADDSPAGESSGHGHSDHKEVIVVRHGEPGAITLTGSAIGSTASAPAKMVKAAFLGVGVSGASDVLSEQLKLPQGVGLVVEFVEKGSPAEKAGIQAKDVLHRLDEQILINPQQLATLVRTFKPGDSVKVTVVRKGESLTLNASLVEKEMPELSASAQSFEFTTTPTANAFVTTPFPTIEVPQAAVPPRVIRVGPGATSRIIKIDDGLRIELETRDGKKTLRVTDKEGKSVFDGPFNTKDEIEKLAPEYRDRVKAAEDGVELREVPATSPAEPKADAEELLPVGPNT